MWGNPEALGEIKALVSLIETAQKTQAPDTQSMDADHPPLPSRSAGHDSPGHD
jgi:hypothetical protein